MCIRVADILELYAAGLSSAQILADDPDLEAEDLEAEDLEAEDLEAALRYAAREVDHPVLVA